MDKNCDSFESDQIINKLKAEVLSIETSTIQLESLVDNIAKYFISLKEIFFSPNQDNDSNKIKVTECFENIDNEFSIFRTDLIVRIRKSTNRIKKHAYTIRNRVPLEDCAVAKKDTIGFIIKQEVNAESAFTTEDSPHSTCSSDNELNSNSVDEEYVDSGKTRDQTATSDIGSVDFIDRLSGTTDEISEQTQNDSRLVEGFIETELKSEIDRLNKVGSDSNFSEKPFLDDIKVVKFSCEFCPKEFLEKRELDGHIKLQCKDKKIYCCKDCGKYFSKNYHLVRHMKTHTGEKPYTCNSCGKGFSVNYRLTNHKKICHTTFSDGCKVFKCKDCGITFKKLSSLTIHKRKHNKNKETGSELFVDDDGHKDKDNLDNASKVDEVDDNMDTAGKEQFKCDICEKICSTLHNLNSHKTKHAHNGRHNCEECGKTYATKEGLRRHIRRHSGEKPYICDQCGKGFADSYYLKTHFLVHSGEKPHTCKQCGKCYASASHYRIHLTTHSELKPFQCDVCGQSFSHSTTLSSHKKIHVRHLPCNECEKMFYKTYHLKRHITRWHRNERLFHCEICGKSFYDNSNLKSHMRIHTGERPFKCSVCDKSFTEAGSLARHMRIHTGEKPFTCEFCGKRFNQSSSLQTHRHNSHSDQILIPLPIEATNIVDQ